MKRSEQGMRHWATLLSTVRVFGYASEVVEDPPTIFCQGERGSLVLRPGFDGEVLMMVDGGSDLLFPQFPTPEFIIENISNYIGAPSHVASDRAQFQQAYLMACRNMVTSVGIHERTMLSQLTATIARRFS